jgi:protein tyrosine/serine phosphatase
MLDLLREKNGDLLHRHAGRDRTGYVIALYRIQQHQWSLARSLQEMEAHGHSRSRRLETTRALQHWSRELAGLDSVRSARR